ncbi:hypothetical protein P147_WWE3C00001G0625 [candidate division WWE3 bacterium RAAC2_WWE3_1]|nr:hypothetical protein P147_WWE3C00001G0625 [candidate division WWE3 bacterium RAAC2_WWE3_1]KKT08312.1 MAG: hypothetical protein UV87_C0004G0001 [candidate division WWE3 bacterium GW2011_GWD1_43_201]
MVKEQALVVVVGGGTGTFVALSGLREYSLNLNAVVTMMDSGGSTGRLKDQLGVLPPGDVRQALVALSESRDIWRKLFTYRFDSGDLQGHNFGNIFISALEKITGSNQEAINLAAEILQTSGNVYPITFSKSSLCAKYSDGSVIEGEHAIESVQKNHAAITEVYLSPPALMNLEAKRILERADYIVLGPGDIYTSIVPNLLVTGMQEVMKFTNAKMIYVSNLMSHPGQTDGFPVSKHVDEINKYLGGNYVNYVLINSNRPSQELLDYYYTIDGTIWVEDDTSDKYKGAKVIRQDLLSNAKVVVSASDKVKRSLIRHDPTKLAAALFEIIDTPSN